MNRFDIEKNLRREEGRFPELKGLNFYSYSIRIQMKYKCPSCGKPVTLRERHDDGTVFFGCTNFPNCRWSQSIGYTIHDKIFEDGIIPLGGYDEIDDEYDWDSDDDRWAEDWESPMYWG